MREYLVNLYDLHSTQNPDLKESRKLHDKFLGEVYKLLDPVIFLKRFGIFTGFYLKSDRTIESIGGTRWEEREDS